MGELKKVFRPELLNRIDEVIVFHKLDEGRDQDDRRADDEAAARADGRRTRSTIELTDEAKELLVEKGYDPAMGARPLRRAIQRYIEDPLADFVLGRVARARLDDPRRPQGRRGARSTSSSCRADVTPEKVTVPPESRRTTAEPADELTRAGRSRTAPHSV